MQTASASFPRFLLTMVAAAVLLFAVAYGGYLIGRSEEAPEPGSEGPQLSAVLATPMLIQSSPTAATAVLTETPAPSATVTATVEMVAPPDVPAVSETAVPAPPLPVVSTAESESLQTEDADLTTFNDVWRLVEDEFDGELPGDKDRIYGAISGSLELLGDDYTRFIRPEIAERMRDELDGSVSGIGAIVRPTEDGRVEIVRPIDNQPADRAGLIGGDIIIEIDGQSVGGLNFDEVLLLVRGPAGTTVQLAVMREGVEDPIEYTLVRAEFAVPVVEAELLETDGKAVGYVRLSSFTRSAEEELRAALRTLIDQNPVGLILDLRDNGGGFLDQAVAVADLFLGDGVVLFERSNSDEFNETFRSESGDLAEQLPLVVLVNAGSASASEIVAGAVQDNKRGILVGETTFGKGSVQHVHTLNDGSELRVTIARWYTPNNRSISDNGIEPDLTVITPQDLGGDDDMQLQRAVDFLTSGE